MTTTSEVAITETSYNITILRPLNNYTFGVVACNEIGCSSQSDLSLTVMTHDSEFNIMFVVEK